MELIPLLREQLDRLCADVSVDPNWMLGKLASALKERYGPIAVGFARWRQTRSDCLQLLGLVAVDGEVVVPVAEDFRADRRHPQADLEASASEVWLAAEQFGTWGRDDVDACFAAARAAFLAPWLIDKPADWMILVLSPIAAPAAHREDRGLTVSANLLATNLLRALDAKRLEQANVWIDRELEEISRLQRLLQPEKRVDIRGIDLAFSSHIYRYAGGDYFDIPVLSHLMEDARQDDAADHFGAIVADVSGHGPSAAVEAAMLDAIMRTYSGPVSAGPEAVAAYLNQHMFTRRPRASFVSAFLCNYHPDTRMLHYVNCGHPPPLLCAKGRKATAMDIPNDIPLRIERQYQWRQCQRKMAPGDVLVLYTDGVTETRDPKGQELGIGGLASLVDGSQPALRILAGIRRGIRRHLGGRTAQDDQTLIVLRWR